MDSKFLSENLANRITEYINLVGQREGTKEIVLRKMQEFNEVLPNLKEIPDIEKEFNRLVSKILPIVEAMGLPEQQHKATRRLILNEIYSSKDEYLRGLKV